MCAGAAALDALTPTQRALLSCCQAPGALQDGSCSPWWPRAGPGALPSLPIPLCPAGQGPSCPPAPSCCFCSLQFHQLIKDWALVSSWWEKRGRLSAGWDFPMGECQLLAPAERASPNSAPPACILLLAQLQFPNFHGSVRRGTPSAPRDMSLGLSCCFCFGNLVF